MIFVSFIMIYSCNENKKNIEENINYKQEMRQFVINLSEFAKNNNSNFVVIPQNGQEILTFDGEIESEINIDYLNAIDGTGREDLYYGYVEDDVKTLKEDSDYMISYLNLYKNNNKKVLSIDYCFTHSKIDDSYNLNYENGFISFAAERRELDIIQIYPEKPFHENENDIITLNEAQNFLYLINPQNYSTKEEFLNDLKNTNYDLIVIDAFFNDELLSKDDVNSIKIKKNGKKRLIISYMSIGEAENYRYYWKEQWNSTKPDFLEKENPNWEGNYKVKYWNKDWQKIIYGNDESYLKKIINSGFDGVYLDIIDAFEYFENN